MSHNVDLTGAKFVKSTRSGGNGGNCVEVALNLPEAPGFVAVRHSKFPGDGTITFTDAEWDAFLGGAKDGEFDK